MWSKAVGSETPAIYCTCVWCTGAHTLSFVLSLPVGQEAMVWPILQMCQVSDCWTQCTQGDLKGSHTKGKGPGEILNIKTHCKEREW